MRSESLVWGVTIGILSHAVMASLAPNALVVMFGLAPLGIALVVAWRARSRMFWNGALGGSGSVLSTAAVWAVGRIRLGNPADPLIVELSYWAAYLAITGIWCGAATWLVARVLERPHASSEPNSAAH